MPSMQLLLYLVYMLLRFFIGVRSGEAFCHSKPSKQFEVVATLLQRWALVQITLVYDVVKT